jgi:Acyl-CoA dehydrogenase, C-terminal domain
MDKEAAELFERALRRAVEASVSGDLDQSLEDLGWRDALGEDPRTAISVLFELLGATNSVSSALDDVLSSQLTERGPPRACVVVPGPDKAEPPGTFNGRRLEVDGLATSSIARWRIALVAASTGDGLALATVETSSFRKRPLAGVDPELGMVLVSASISSGYAQVPAPLQRWEAALRLGRLAVAHQLVGAARMMLQMARDHAVERVQFGKPIASFQAVRHRLAESLVALEGADAAVAAAWESSSPVATAMAKAVAGHGALAVARHAQQVLGGIGFTAEHPFHHFFRRSLVLDHLLGSARRLTVELGEDLVRHRRLPEMLPL